MRVWIILKRDTLNTNLMMTCVVTTVVLLLPSILPSGVISTINSLESSLNISKVMQPVNAQEETPSENMTNNKPQEETPSENMKPIAVAGPDQTVKSGDGFDLDGTDSKDPDCDDGISKWCTKILEYEWQQINSDQEMKVWDLLDETDDVTRAKQSFTAPSVAEKMDLKFELTVTDDEVEEDNDYVTITVEPAPLQGNQLALKIQLEKNPINVGDKETITVTAIDKSSNKEVANATIQGKVTYHNREIEKFSDSGGKALYSWKIASKSDPGTFKIMADASAEGYEPGYESVTFDVVNKDGSISDGTTLSEVRSTADKLGNTFYSTLSKTKDLVSDLQQNHLSRFLPFAGLAVGAGALAYGIYRSKKSKHNGTNVAVLTRGGIE